MLLLVECVGYMRDMSYWLNRLKPILMIAMLQMVVGLSLHSSLCQNRVEHFDCSVAAIIKKGKKRKFLVLCDHSASSEMFIIVLRCCCLNELFHCFLIVVVKFLLFQMEVCTNFGIELDASSAGALQVIFASLLSLCLVMSMIIKRRLLCHCQPGMPKCFT